MATEEVRSFGVLLVRFDSTPAIRLQQQQQPTSDQ